MAATNALELGVDVGALDATLHLGFQGSVASMRQQGGSVLGGSAPFNPNAWSVLLKALLDWRVASG